MPPSENTPEEIRLFLAESAGIDPEELNMDAPLSAHIEDADVRGSVADELERRLRIHLPEGCRESFEDGDISTRAAIDVLMAQEKKAA